MLGGEQENLGTEHSSSSCGTARSTSSFGQNSKFFKRDKFNFLTSNSRPNEDLSC